jgi:hypothetical protein
MAELSDHDKRVLLGGNYKAPEATEASPAEKRAANRALIRNIGIAIVIVAAIALYTTLYHSV